MNVRQKAHAELQHALNALGDGCGDGRPWGPGPVGAELGKRDVLALEAWDMAAADVYDLVRRPGGEYLVPKRSRPAFIAAMRKLAPVILDIRLDALGAE